MKIEKLGLSIEEVERFIDNYIFSARDRKILKNRWLNSVKLDTLAEKCNLSVRQVNRIVDAAEEKIIKHYKK